MSTKVGLTTGSAMPRPAASPWVRVVFPDPRSPSSRITSSPRQCVPSSRPTSAVSAAERDTLRTLRCPEGEGVVPVTAPPVPRSPSLRKGALGQGAKGHADLVVDQRDAIEQGAAVRDRNALNGLFDLFQRLQAAN